MTVLPYGPRGWLVELAEDDVVGYARAVARAGHPDVVELVPAARTVLVRLGESSAPTQIGAWLATIEPDRVERTERVGQIDIAVTYDGADLQDVAAASGLDVAGVIERHTHARYDCAFCGFAPGFAYLRGLDPALHLPRRSTPRTRVPAGAVAIADAYAAVYPSASPGGWHLLGRTDVRLWDAEREPPALIIPGTTVRFVDAHR